MCPMRYSNAKMTGSVSQAASSAAAVGSGPPLGGAGLLWQVRTLGKLTQEEPAEATSLSPRSIGNLEHLRRDNIMITANTAAVSAKYYRTSAPNRADGSNRLWRKRYRLAVGIWGEGGSHGPRAGRKLSP
jgi:hypothetical protein